VLVLGVASMNLTELILKCFQLLRSNYSFYLEKKQKAVLLSNSKEV